jgi:hypothetical protein
MYACMYALVSFPDSMGWGLSTRLARAIVYVVSSPDPTRDYHVCAQKEIFADKIFVVESYINHAHPIKSSAAGKGNE